MVLLMYKCVAFLLIGRGCVLNLCVNLHIFVSCLVFFILYFCIFVLGCGSLVSNEDVMRFRGGVI